MDMSPERYSGDNADNNTILPLHCVVQVTGNNRTKLSLLGQRGVIIQAGDLGGWHTLVRGAHPPTSHAEIHLPHHRSSIRRCSRAGSKCVFSAMH